MPVPPAANVKEVAKYFSDVLGPNEILVVPSGRPYVPIAKKDKMGSVATLLMNVDFEQMPHKVLVGDETKVVPALGVCIRFFQRGGDEKAFCPPLQARTKMQDLDGVKVMRLSKHTFPMCLAAPYMNFMAAWNDQNITEQIMEWINGICDFASATPLALGMIEEIVTMPLSKLQQPPGANPMHFFSLDVKKDDTGVMADDEDKEPVETE